MSRKSKNPHIGSSFDDLLKEDGIYEEVTAQSIKRVLAWQIMELMEELEISKSEMARRMDTSRSYLDRFLDPEHSKVQLDTIMKAAKAVGRELHVELK